MRARERSRLVVPLQLGAGLGFALLSLPLAVQHSVSRTDLGVATSLNQFARTIGGAAGVAIMGAILSADLGGSSRLGPSALEVAGLSALSPDLRQRLITSLQRAFVTGAVSAGIALVASFWVPPFSSGVKPTAGEEMLSAEMTTLDAEAEPVGIED